MPTFVPPSHPRMGYSEILPKLQAIGYNPAVDPLIVVGVRGYYKNSMGVRDANDTGIYDDAIFLITPYHFSSYNANTDPSSRKPGHGVDERTRGRARLRPGLWKCYRFDPHDGPSDEPYDAICQRDGPVTVMRDGHTQDYPHTGKFGINIHRGKRTSTSSAGCQTIYPTQWGAFISAAQDQARRCFANTWKATTIPYALLVNDWD